MTEKQAILRDLKVIAILNNKIDYSDHDNIGAVLELNPKSLFSTEYGQRYLDRIRAMYDGKEYEHTCILCGSPLDGANPVCDNCYKMITLGNAVVPKKPEKIVSHEAEKISPEKSAETVSSAEAAPAAETEQPKEASAAETMSAAENAPAAETAAKAAENEQPAEVPVSEAETAAETASTAEESPEAMSSAETAPVAEVTSSTDNTAAAEAAATAENASAATTAPAAEAAPAAETAESAPSATAVDQTDDDDDKSSDDPDFNHGSDNSVKGEKMIELSRALILLFVIMCFTIAIVCGVVLGIRDLRIKNQNREEQSQSEAIIEDADLRDYYSMIAEKAPCTMTIEIDS